MKTLEELADITDQNYFDKLLEEDTVNNMVLYAASVKERWNIKVFDFEAKSRFEYSVENAAHDIEMVALSSFFGVKLVSCSS